MNAVNSILHFLVYVSLLLAPKDADHITITGPDAGEAMELVRDGQQWTSRLKPVSISEGSVLLEGVSIPLDARERGFIATASANDWLKMPRLALDGVTSLEKTSDGFLLRFKEGDDALEYRIRHHRSAAGEITVNVLGEVNQPGTYRIPAGGSLVDAVAAAGGWTKQANRKKTSLVRGPAGQVPTVAKYDLDSILKGSSAPPTLQERDTVHVPESLF